ncbi:MAG: hypothetical protein ACI9TY_001404 [Alphaproteobacteria bacterium]|jgi:hypothetical protein
MRGFMNPSTYSYNTSAGTVSGPSFNIAINGNDIKEGNITQKNILKLTSIYLKAAVKGTALPVTRMNMFNQPSMLSLDPQFLTLIHRNQQNGENLRKNEYLYKQGYYLRWLNAIVEKTPENLCNICESFEKIYDANNPHYRMDKDGNINRMWQ